MVSKGGPNLWGQIPPEVSMTSLVSGTAHSARRHRPVLVSSDAGPPASDPIGPVPCSGGDVLDA